jgi:hypothetical protein
MEFTAKKNLSVLTAQRTGRGPDALEKLNYFLCWESNPVIGPAVAYLNQHSGYEKKDM